MVLAKIIFYLRKIENGEGKTREGGLHSEGELRKKNEELRRAAPGTRGTEGSPFGFYRALLQREYIPYFRRGLGERPKERPKRSKEKKRGERREMQKGISEGEEEARYAGEEKRARRFLHRREYIFHLPDDARDGSNHDYGSNNSRDFEY